MGEIIFVRRPDGPVVELRRSEFDREVDLQQLLADHPKLLEGDEMRGDEPRRWLYVASEVGVPGEEGGGGRWGADLVFVDQDGIPAIVEVKRQGDTRLRREVISQMLDYAAHAETYWQNDYLYRRMVERCEEQGGDPDEVLEEFLGVGADLAEFWEQVHTNLRAGRLAIVLASDEIPPETRRIIEFLNEQMSPAEVFALEIGYFLGEFEGRELQALVPKLIGITEASRVRRDGSRHKVAWNIPEAVEAIIESCADRASCIREIMDAIGRWADDRDLVCETGRGEGAKILIRYPARPNAIRMFNIGADCRVEIPLGPRPAPFDTIDARRELAARLRALDGFEIDESDLEGGWPKFPLELLCEGGVLEAFLVVWDWFIERCREHEDGETDGGTTD